MPTSRLLVRDVHVLLAIVLIVFVLARYGYIMAGRMEPIGREADAEWLGPDTGTGNDQPILARGYTLVEHEVHGLRAFLAEIGVRPVRGRRVENGPVPGGEG